MRKREAEEPEPEGGHPEKDDLPLLASAWERARGQDMWAASGMWEGKEKDFFLRAPSGRQPCCCLDFIQQQ